MGAICDRGGLSANAPSNPAEMVKLREHLQCVSEFSNPRDGTTILNYDSAVRQSDAEQNLQIPRQIEAKRRR